MAETLLGGNPPSPLQTVGAVEDKWVAVGVEPAVVGKGRGVGHMDQLRVKTHTQRRADSGGDGSWPFY